MAKTQLPSWQIQAQALLLLHKIDNPGFSGGNDGYGIYQDDPHGFCVSQFGETYTDDVKAVMESVRHNVVTIARSANATGKTHSAARIATWFYKSFPNSRVYTAAAPPESNLRKLLWAELYGLVRKHAALFADDRVLADMNISRNTEEFITGVTIPQSGKDEEIEERFSGKHAPHMLFIVDEGNSVPEAVYKGIESCMSGGIIVRLLIMFNPRGKYGPVSKMEVERRGHVCVLSAFNHPNVKTGQDVIPGAVTQVTTLRRINMWSRPLAFDENPDVECFQVPDFLVGLTCEGLDGESYMPLPAGHRKITNPAFFYMVLGEYPPQAETQLISRVWVDAAVSRWLTYVAEHGETPPVRDGIAGLDVAEFGKDWNVLCLRFGGFVPRMNWRWQGIDTDLSATKTKEYIKSLKNKMVVNVDATGIGSGIAPKLKRGGIPKANGIKVATSPTYSTEMGEFLQLRDQLWWSTMLWLRDDPGAMLPPDDELAEELTTPLYWVDLKGKIRITDKEAMRGMLGRSPDKADALNLTHAPEPVPTTIPKARSKNYLR